MDLSLLSLEELSKLHAFETANFRDELGKPKSFEKLKLIRSTLKSIQDEINRRSLELKSTKIQ